MDTKILEIRYNLMQQAIQLSAREENLSEENIIKKFRFLVNLLHGEYDYDKAKEIKPEKLKE